MNIVLFDEQQAITNTLEKYFQNSDGFKLAGTFNQSIDLINYLTHSKADIIITVILTDEELGPKLIAKIRKKAPKSLIVIYSAVTLDIIKENCKEAGADICISNSDEIEALHQAILSIVETKKIKDKNKVGKKTNSLTLTTKERIIIECMIKGLSSPEIAEKLGLSPNTINNQKNHMIKKFDCSSSTELVANLFRKGLLKVSEME